MIAMITNITDLDAALAWMRRSGFEREELDTKWPLCVKYGGFDLVCNGPGSQWTIWTKLPTEPPPHGFYRDVVVAPWVVEVVQNRIKNQGSDRP